jgi:hypothetical protein
MVSAACDRSSIDSRRAALPARVSGSAFSFHRPSGHSMKTRPILVAASSLELLPRTPHRSGPLRRPRPRRQSPLFRHPQPRRRRRSPRRRIRSLLPRRCLLAHRRRRPHAAQPRHLPLQSPHRLLPRLPQTQRGLHQRPPPPRLPPPRRSRPPVSPRSLQVLMNGEAPRKLHSAAA